MYQYASNLENKVNELYEENFKLKARVKELEDQLSRNSLANQINEYENWLANDPESEALEKAYAEMGCTLDS